MENQNIFDYVLEEEKLYQTQGVPIVDNWEWSMYRHVKRSTLYKYGKFEEGADDGNRPNNNIIRPILNVQYRSEGFDVKDITPFVNEPKNYFKSFFVRKFHEKWARKNDIDTFIDEVVESYVDYGGVLVKNVNNVRPEVVPLQRLAFCDQTDLLNGAKAEKHMFSIDQLLDMKGKWDDNEIDVAIEYATTAKTNSQSNNQKQKTPTKYIEVYEVHGTFPESWLASKYPEYENSKDYCMQMHVITYTKDEHDNKIGLTLFKAKEKENIYKVLLRDKIYGRALGYGGVEELFEPQVWINYNEIQMKEMLDQAALMLMQTADEAYRNKNKTKNLAKGEILIYEDNKPITRIDNQAPNFEKFNNAVDRWQLSARTIGSANDAQLGLNPASGTPLGTTQIVTNQGQGIHEYRQGKIATFIAEIYRDWGLQYLVDEMNQGNQWISELDYKEMQWLEDQVTTGMVNKFTKEAILGGKMLSQEDIDAYKTLIQTSFKKDNKKFLETIKDEFKSIPIDVEMNVAGKQKNLQKMTDSLSNIIRQIIGAPQILQIPGMADIFNELLETSGLSPANFSGLTTPPPQQPQAQASPGQIPQSPTLSPLQPNLTPTQ